MLLLPDSSVLIPYIREGQYAEPVRRATRDGRLLLCSVVATEIRAGARNQDEQRSYDAFFDVFYRRGLIATPTDADWHACGRILSRYRRRFGAIEPRDHQNDVLILLTAVRAARSDETRLLTENDAHFTAWLNFVQNAPGMRIEPMRRG